MMILNALHPQHIWHYRLNYPRVLLAAGYGVVIVSLLTSVASGHWEWLESSGCVLGLCGWYVEKLATHLALARFSIVFGSLVWSYTTLLLS